MQAFLERSGGGHREVTVDINERDLLSQVFTNQAAEMDYRAGGVTPTQEEPAS